MNYKILSAQETKTSAEADEMLKKVGALPAEQAAGIFLLMPKDEYDKLVKESGVSYPDFWIGKGLLARSVVVRRGVVADRRPSDRLGVLALFDGKGHEHNFKNQPKKCDCGEVDA